MEMIFNLPILGSVDLASFSLPVLTFIVSALDGFNPCAMWTLVFLISMLLGIKDKKRMWGLGITFIITSGLVYFLFLSAWLNVFLFLGFVFWIRLFVGVVAISAGVYYLREYKNNKDGACKVVRGKRRANIIEKMKKVVEERSFLLAFLGIIVLAVAVNMIELVCSAGLPAVYTQILALNNLPAWKYYAYLVFYIIIFMVDDIVVFVIAMVTLKTAGITGKYSRFSHLVGGILMFIVGILLLFYPQALTFG